MQVYVFMILSIITKVKMLNSMREQLKQALLG